MKKSTRKHYLKMRGFEIIEKAEKEVRQLSEDEQTELQQIIDELTQLNAKNELVEEFKEAIESVEDEPQDEEPQEEEEESRSEDSEDEEPQEEPAEEEPQEEPAEEQPSEDEEENNKKRNNNIIMNKKEVNFSLLKAIRAIANNQKLDEYSAAVVKAGEAEARAAGISTQGQIQIPTQRAAGTTVTVEAEGEDVVVTDILDLMTPLRARNVLAQAGAKFMSGLQGDVQVPIMSGNNVAWEGEIADAPDAEPTFSSVKLTPHRLTAYVDISKQFIIQNSVDAENAIREDLINAINSKLEATILGDGDGMEGGAVVIAPVGMLNTLSATNVADYEDLCEKEAEIEDANILGECKYVMSNKAKATLRSMIKGTNGTGMVYEANAVDGTPAYNTSNVKGYNYIYGDWSNLAIGAWGGIDITVDPYTKAAAGQVRIVVNAFFDAKMLRESAFTAGDVSSL